MKNRRKKIIIVERKLGREKSVGLCYQNERFIEVDPRQRPRPYLNTLVHELLHVAFPDAPHSKIEKGAGIIAAGLWQQKYRRTIQ